MLFWDKIMKNRTLLANKKGLWSLFGFRSPDLERVKAVNLFNWNTCVKEVMPGGNGWRSLHSCTLSVYTRWFLQHLCQATNCCPSVVHMDTNKEAVEETDNTVWKQVKRTGPNKTSAMQQLATSCLLQFECHVHPNWNQTPSSNTIVCHLPAAGQDAS